MCADRFCEHELAAHGVVRDGLRVAPVEACEAEPVVRQVQGREDTLDREVAERVRTDEVADLLDGARRRRINQPRMPFDADDFRGRKARMTQGYIACRKSRS